MIIKTSIKQILIVGYILLLSTYTLQAQTSDGFYRTMNALYDQYRGYYDSQKFDLAIQPLNDLVQFLDTATVDIGERVINSYKSDAYYNLACCYSLTHQKNPALKTLEQAIQLGYKDYGNMKSDTDLDFIRKDKKFKALLEQLRQFDHLFVLKSVGPYCEENKDSLPHFSYQSVDDVRLQAVREMFKLDSVAGQGSEISKIINILNYIHNTIRHDGNNYALCEFDAIDFYNYHKATGKGINCRHLAIALNEMYLSMGIPSRYVTCMPKDPDDLDCHVINTVWSSELQKWIWIDPTFNAYVMDEHGLMLGIAEVRERLIEDRPLVLNEDANWNNESKQTKEHYLENYMAKNLYYFECVEESCFNPESRYRYAGSKYVRLLPLEFEIKDDEWITNTHDEGYFWQAPK